MLIAEISALTVMLIADTTRRPLAHIPYDKSTFNDDVRGSAALKVLSRSLSHSPMADVCRAPASCRRRSLSRLASSFSCAHCL